MKTIVKNDEENLFFFPVNNNAASPDRAARLRAVVEKTAAAQSYIRRQVPLTWLQVSQASNLLSFITVLFICLFIILLTHK